MVIIFTLRHQYRDVLLSCQPARLKLWARNQGARTLRSESLFYILALSLSSCRLETSNFKLFKPWFDQIYYVHSLPHKAIVEI